LKSRLTAEVQNLWHFSSRAAPSKKALTNYGQVQKCRLCFDFSSSCDLRPFPQPQGSKHEGADQQSTGARLGHGIRATACSATTGSPHDVEKDVIALHVQFEGEPVGERREEGAQKIEVADAAGFENLK